MASKCRSMASPKERLTSSSDKPKTATSKSVQIASHTDPRR